MKKLILFFIIILFFSCETKEIIKTRLGIIKKIDYHVVDRWGSGSDVYKIITLDNGMIISEPKYDFRSEPSLNNIVSIYDDGIFKHIFFKTN